MITIIEGSAWRPWRGSHFLGLCSSRRDFLRHGSGVRLAVEKGGPAIRVRGGAKERRRRTVGLAIPCQVASPQSPTPFHQATHDRLPLSAVDHLLVRRSVPFHPYRGERGTPAHPPDRRARRRFAERATGSAASGLITHHQTFRSLASPDRIARCGLGAQAQPARGPVARS